MTIDNVLTYYYLLIIYLFIQIIKIYNYLDADLCDHMEFKNSAYFQLLLHDAIRDRATVIHEGMVKSAGDHF